MMRARAPRARVVTVGVTGNLRRRAAIVIVVAANAFASGSARGDAPTASDAAAAEALFHEGRKLLAEGNVSAACPKFAESYRLDPALGSLLNLATCHEQEGRTASAWSEFRDAEAQAGAMGDAARQHLAAKHAAALEPKLCRVRIDVDKHAPGIAVSRDGVALGDGAFGTELPVDPGPHQLAARASGYKPWSTRFVAVAGETVRIAVPALERAPPETAPVAAPDQPATSADPKRTIGLVVGAVGIAALAVGGVFVGLTAAKKNDADAQCPDKACTADGQAAIESAKTYARIADVGIAVGAAAIIGGAILFLTAGGPRRPGSASVSGRGFSTAIRF